jgi:hypothetical protein
VNASAGNLLADDFNDNAQARDTQTTVVAAAAVLLMLLLLQLLCY